MITEDIIKISGAEPGPTVAVFAGVHGDELAGVYALQQLLPDLQISKGTLYVAFANPPAIAAGVRMQQKNLNRCFSEDNKGDTYEDKRARQLMAVLDQCDALLDLHMYYDDDGEPFIICEEDAVPVAQTFDIDIISTNWTIAEPGATDGYMYKRGKIGICVECGPISKAHEYIDFAKQTVRQFLQYFDMLSGKIAVSNTKKQIIAATHSVYKVAEDFVLQPGLKSFDALKPGQLIAKDAQQEYRAGEGEYIIFPHYNARVGEEAYIIGKTTEI